MARPRHSRSPRLPPFMRAGIPLGRRRGPAAPGLWRDRAGRRALRAPEVRGCCCAAGPCAAAGAHPTGLRTAPLHSLLQGGLDGEGRPHQVRGPRLRGLSRLRLPLLQALPKLHCYAVPVPARQRCVQSQPVHGRGARGCMGAATQVQVQAPLATRHAARAVTLCWPAVASDPGSGASMCSGDSGGPVVVATDAGYKQVGEGRRAAKALHASVLPCCLLRRPACPRACSVWPPCLLHPPWAGWRGDGLPRRPRVRRPRRCDAHGGGGLPRVQVRAAHKLSAAAGSSLCGGGLQRKQLPLPSPQAVDRQLCRRAGGGCHQRHRCRQLATASPPPAAASNHAQRALFPALQTLASLSFSRLLPAIAIGSSVRSQIMQ